VEEQGVTFLGSDIDKDGGKLILVAGTPRAPPVRKRRSYRHPVPNQGYKGMSLVGPSSSRSADGRLCTVHSGDAPDSAVTRAHQPPQGEGDDGLG
jgi:hypothetical protein